MERIKAYLNKNTEKKGFNIFFWVPSVLLVIVIIAVIVVGLRMSSDISKNTQAIEAIANQISSAQTLLSQADSKITAWQGQLGSLTAKENSDISGLKTQLSSSSSQLADFQNQLNSKDALLSSLSDQVNSVSSQLSSLQDEISSVNSTLYSRWTWTYPFWIIQLP